MITIASDAQSLQTITQDYRTSVGKAVKHLESAQKKNQTSEQQSYQIEYFVTNMKDTLSKDKRYIAQLLSTLSDKNVTYLEIESL